MRYDSRQLLAAAGLIIAAVSAAALAGAWGLQIFGGYEPCPLCLEQRIPYYFAVPVGVVVALLAGKSPRAAGLLLAVTCLALIYNAGLGVYHAGAEWHFWQGPDTCGATQDLTLKPGGLSKALQHNRPVRCDEAALRIFGLSLAGYSVLISAGLALLGIVALFRSKFWRKGNAG